MHIIISDICLLPSLFVNGHFSFPSTEPHILGTSLSLPQGWKKSGLFKLKKSLFKSGFLYFFVQAGNTRGRKTVDNALKDKD